MWLVVLPGNFIIDSLVLLAGMFALHMEAVRKGYQKYILKVYIFGMLADLAGAAYMLLMLAGFDVGNMGDEPYLTIPALVISAILIFVLNDCITFRKVDGKNRWLLSLILAVTTAPYTFLIPSDWLYR